MIIAVIIVIGKRMIKIEIKNCSVLIEIRNNQDHENSGSC